MAGIAASFDRAIAIFRNFAFAALCLTAAGCAPASDSHSDAFDFYVLALSWSPSFCASAGPRGNEEQCGREADHGFIVHGLWPQFESGWPEFCDTSEANVARGTLAAIDDLMPSDALIRHQWRKHGSCTGLSQAAYFQRTRDAFERIEIPSSLEGGSSHAIAGTRVADAFIAANPGLERDGMAVTCGDGMVREVRICLTQDLAFRDCPQVSERSCRRGGLRMPAR